MLPRTRANQIVQPHGLPGRPAAPYLPDNPKQSAKAARPAPKNKTPILDLFPEVRVFNFGAKSLYIPPGYAACPAGLHAWYGIGKIDLMASIGMEGALAAVRVSALPTYPDDPAELQWGDKFGEGAALMVGSGLPIIQDAWNYAGCDVPAVTGTLSNGQKAYWHVETFPGGSQSNTIPVRQNTYTFFGGGLARMPAATTLDVAFLLNRTQYNNADAGGQIVNVRFSLTAYVLPTKIIKNFTQL